MALTFAQWKVRLAKAVLRDDLADDYGTFLNEALLKIQQKRSWLAMRTSADLVIPTGAGRETIALPAGFKELQKRQAVQYLADGGGFIPADVVTEEQQIYRVWAFGGTPLTTWPPRIFLERQATGSVLGVIEPLSQVLNIRVKYFQFLPELVTDSATSPIADAYPGMVLAKAKVVAFTEINDPIAAAFETEFDKQFAEAARQEAYSEVVGRETRM